MGGLSLVMATGVGCINPIQEREVVCLLVLFYSHQFMFVA